MTAQPSASLEVDQPERSQFARWAYLIFFAFIFIGPAFNPEAGLEGWILEIVVGTLSITMYVIAELSHRRQLGAMVLMAITLVATPLGSAAISVLPLYAAALASVHGMRRQVVARLVAINVLTLAGLLTSPVPWPYRAFFLVSVVMCWIVGLSVFEDASLEAHAGALRAENARIAHLATMSERERIARDLHDLAGHALTAIVLRSQLIQRTVESDPHRARSEADAIESMARETLDSVRQTVAGWHQASLGDELDVATEALEAAGAHVETTGHWNVDIAPSIETVLALSLREAVTNIVRHARAQHVQLQLDAPNGGIRLVVTDDGVGYKGTQGSGLRGMRDRVTATGGNVTIETTPGTMLTIEMPFGGRAR